MVSRGIFIGVSAVLVALLLIVSIVAGLYFFQYQQEASANASYANELGGEISKYNSVVGGFDSSLSDYNATLSVLAQAVSNLNTSSSAYLNASRELPSLWGEYLALARSQKASVSVYSVDMLVDYGNGTESWYNDTAVQPGWNAYEATLVLLDNRIQATWYPAYQEHFVNGLNGVPGTSTTSWFLWLYSDGSWQTASSGPDPIRALNGTVLAWTLCGYDQNFNPTCAP